MSEVDFDRPYASKTFAEVVDDYVLVRGDLSEPYARAQLVREHEARLVSIATDYAEAGAEATERMIDAEAAVSRVRELIEANEERRLVCASDPNCPCSFKDCYECGKWHNCTHTPYANLKSAIEGTDRDV